jgi:hypothetical protein
MAGANALRRGFRFRGLPFLGSTRFAFDTLNSGLMETCAFGFAMEFPLNFIFPLRLPQASRRSGTVTQGSPPG